MRYACSIQLEESVIITGGSYSEKRVEQYNLAGSMERLPDLKNGRRGHACESFIKNTEVVSTSKVSTVVTLHFRIIQPSAR